MTADTKPDAGPAPTVAVFDLDGTIVRGDSYLQFLLFGLRRVPGRRLRLPDLVAAAALHKAGFRDNTWLKCYFLKAVFGGVGRPAMESLTDAFVSRVFATGLFADALTRIDAHRRSGDRLVLASASLDIYVTKIGDRLGFDDVVCTAAAWADDGTVSGGLVNGNCYGAAKVSIVRQHLDAAYPDSPLTVYTDHHSDLPLLRCAARPFAVNPTRALRAAARRDGIPVLEWT